MKGIIYRNIPNVVSILGVLPLVILFTEDGYKYLIPLIIYNNLMDDLDGILAGKLNLRSDFGARMDNVCDSISHTIIIMVISVHYNWICIIAGLIAVTAVQVRSITRLDPSVAKSAGSPTNELIRHSLFAVLLATMFDFDATYVLVGVFIANAITMFVPYPMPYLIRSMTKSTLAVLGVNVALTVAWLVPNSLIPISTAFICTYLYSAFHALVKSK
ncbi:MAG: CDP-alcohol phosphatidyltransferase family protein [Flavobacteriales bacterium]|nr:CDP-alcohol phosphatidyltransferase family protein [Flavobacteriales bacterium]